MSVARPYWLGDQKRMAWGLLALLVGLMVLETQLAVMLIDKTGELTSAWPPSRWTVSGAPCAPA